MTTSVAGKTNLQVEPVSARSFSWVSLRSTHPTNLCLQRTVGWVERSETHHCTAISNLPNWLLV